ncbi:MAG TPA: ATP-binding protein [Candidatus Olsenella excrementigallinarum]|nr:ATP-binding protein [Candidatus Olsenella excrementigallinarum]
MSDLDTDRTIRFDTANRAASHLGRRLYGTTPPALAELVANSFDAYATRVDIVHVPAAEAPDNRDVIIVADNGVGMSVRSLRDRYAHIGREKEADEAPDGMLTRPAMGQKGIGKLAAFSIGDQYTVYSKSRDDDEWVTFSLNYKELVGSETAFDATYETASELPRYIVEHIEGAEGQKSGFIVVISQLRRSWSRQTERSLPPQLSRRFCLSSDLYNFHLLMGGEPLDLSKHDYYESLQLVCFFGYAEDEVRDLLGEGDGRIYNEIDAGSLSAEDRECYQDLIDRGLKGWIGFVDKPSKLKARDDENNFNVVVYVNDKIADEDIFRSSPDSTFASKYMVGEIRADYLGESSDGESLITSSRQGLDHDEDEVIMLLRVARIIRGKSITRWNAFREKKAVSDLPDYISKDSDYSSWVQGLDETSRKLNGKLIRAIKPAIDSGDADESAVKALVNGTIEMVETARRDELFAEIGEIVDAGDSELIVAKMVTLMHRLNLSEAHGLYRVNDERLRAIEKLQQLVKEGAVEKKFQSLLGENPWMINPTWRAVDESDEDEEFSAIREDFNRLVDDERAQEDRDDPAKTKPTIHRTFIDLLVTISDHGKQSLIIVEMKRDKVTSYSHVTYTKIYDQITKYRRAIIQNRDGWAGVQPEDIPAYFIVPSDSGLTGDGNALPFSPGEIRLLNESNITLIRYRDLIRDCKRTLSNEISLRKKSQGLPYFSTEGVTSQDV